MISKLMENYTLWGLEFNLKTTKHVAIGDISRNWELEDVGNVKEHNYLGVMVTNYGNLEAEKNNRIKTGRAVK